MTSGTSSGVIRPSLQVCKAMQGVPAFYCISCLCQLLDFNGIGSRRHWQHLLDFLQESRSLLRQEWERIERHSTYPEETCGHLRSPDFWSGTLDSFLAPILDVLGFGIRKNLVLIAALPIKCLAVCVQHSTENVVIPTLYCRWEGN